MKILKYIAILITAGMLYQCTPKVTDGAQATSDKTMEEVKSKGNDFRSMAPKGGPAREIEIGSYENFTLENGMRVIVVENNKIPRVSFRLFLDKDEALEKEKAGMASIAGDLLSKGTATKTKAEIDEAVDFIGASMSSDARGGFASSLTKHSDKILSLFSDVILNPAFNQDEFDKIKTQTLSGLESNKDDPSAISQNVSSVLKYGKDHPYGEIETELSIQNIELADTKNYYDTYFKPNISYMVVVGDITPAKAKGMVEKYFGDWKKGDVPTHDYAMPKGPDATNVSFVDKAGAVQSVINITYPINLKPGADDLIATRVLNNILGGGFSSRLFSNLREDKAYTYGAYSSISSDELVGSMSAGASVRNEVTDSSVTEFLYELNKINTELVTDQELTLAKNAIAGSFARSLEGPQTVANFALNTIRYNLPSDYYSTYLERLEKVNAQDVLAVAKKYIRPENMNIVVVGNSGDVASKLDKFASSGKADLYDYYGRKKKQHTMSDTDMSAKDVVMNYIKVLGGAEKLGTVKSMKTDMSMSMMGQPISVTLVQQPPYFNMSMNTQGMTVMKQVYDGEKAMIEQMGQKQVIEGEQADLMSSQGKIFPELEYMESPYELMLKGIEDVDGVAAYQISVDDGNGVKATEYYSVESGLKIKSINTMEQGGQSVTTTSEYGDYKEVSGVMIPYKVKVTTAGAGQQVPPMAMEVQNVEVNPTIDASMFKVEK